MERPDVPQGNVQLGARNYMNFFIEYFTTERTLDIKDEDGQTIIHVSLSWIHEAPGERMVYAASVRIKIQVVDDDQAESLILNEYRDHPEDFHKLIKEGCGSFMYLVSVHRGSVIFYIKTDNCETMSSLVTSLQTGTFNIFLRKLFMREPVYAEIKGKTLEVNVQMVVPKTLIVVEEYVGVAKAAVKDIIELDKQERRQKTATTRRFRDVADFIERAEREEARRRRNALAATAGLAAAAAIFTFGTSLVASAVGAAAVGATVLAMGTFLYNLLKDDPIQMSAEDSRKDYVDVFSKYRDALLKVPRLKEIDNPVVLSLLEDIDEVSRLELLRRYLQNPSSVRVKDKVEIRIESETLNLADMILLDILKMIFGLSGSSVERTRGMADQIANFEILETR